MLHDVMDDVQLEQKLTPRSLRWDLIQNTKLTQLPSKVECPFTGEELSTEI
jgi:hypothetical protein